MDAEVPAKRNQYTEDNAIHHFLFARVAYREEFISKFKEECCMYSSDNMNKFKMGPATIVSQYHQQLRFFYGKIHQTSGIMIAQTLAT